MAPAQSRGQKNRRGRPKGQSEKNFRRGIQVHAMRNSAVPERVIASLLEVDGVTKEDAGPPSERIKQALDRWEKPVRAQTPTRDRKARAAFGYAQRHLGACARRSTATDAFDDPDVLRAYIAFLEAIGGIWRAERAAGVFTQWLPPYMRDDPFAELDAEINRMSLRLAEILCERVADLDRQIAEVRRDAQSSAMARLRTRKKNPSAAREGVDHELEEFAAAWIDGRGELAKFDSAPSFDLGDDERGNPQRAGSIDDWSRPARKRRTSDLRSTTG